MTSPSSTASSSIPGDAYFADLYPLYSPVHSRSPSPVYCPPPPPPPPPPSFAASPESMGRYSNRKNKRRHCGDNNNNNLHHSHSHGHGHGHGSDTGHKPYHKPSIPPPFRPRLEFASAPAAAATTPYRPGLSFLSTDGSSAANGNPLTPESPVGGMGEEKCIPREVCVKEEKEDRGGRISAQVRCFC
ncbi:hypothetical protein V492_08130 [Pseudogymnoascus sp. VKM F-4246]|nr:hypothetical protein V492_08130 [Pseudogymnoascus sp. VKM F-4246]